MIVSLWEDKVIQFNEALTSTNEKAAFVIITGLLTKKYSAKTTLTLFNKEVERLISISVQTIIDEIGKDNLTSEIPHTVRNVIDKRCAFEVKLTSFNKDGREDYSVACLSELTDNPPGPPQEENSDAASTSISSIGAENSNAANTDKRQKLA
ncbi:hypothetical protein AgCh_008272 [Apium graveolens]